MASSMCAAVPGSAPVSAQNSATFFCIFVYLWWFEGWLVALGGGWGWWLDVYWTHSASRGRRNKGTGQARTWSALAVGGAAPPDDEEAADAPDAAAPAAAEPPVLLM